MKSATENLEKAAMEQQCRKRSNSKKLDNLRGLGHLLIALRIAQGVSLRLHQGDCRG